MGEMTMAKLVEKKLVAINYNKTSIGSKPSLTKMNKDKRRRFKKYRGQGR